MAIFHVFATPPISIVPWNLYIYSFIWKISCKNHMIYIDHRMIEKICEILVRTYLYHKCKYSWKHDNKLKNICPYDGLESTLRKKEILNVRTAFFSLHLIIDFTKKSFILWINHCPFPYNRGVNNGCTCNDENGIANREICDCNKPQKIEINEKDNQRC